MIEERERCIAEGEAINDDDPTSRPLSPDEFVERMANGLRALIARLPKGGRLDARSLARAVFNALRAVNVEILLVLRASADVGSPGTIYER